jgi:murein L,D-transpeptidase YcbB/YkuD
MRTGLRYAQIISLLGVIGLSEAATRSLYGDTVDVTAELRELLTTKDRVVFDRASDRGAIIAFYRDRQFSRLWIDKGKLSPRAQQLGEYLAHAGDDGLEPRDYAIENPLSAPLAQTELRMTAAVIRYARDVTHGRIENSAFNREIDYRREPFMAANVLSRIESTSNIADAMGDFRPQQTVYRALRSKLATLREQQRNGAAADENEIKAILANLERWRWMPRDLGTNHVMVNIPAYGLEVIRNGSKVWSTKIVVGGRSTATPLLSASMTSITLNPIWNVPRSIVESEYRLLFKNDPDFAESIKMRSVVDRDGRLHMYQLPGEMNALGQLRFNFPNQFAIYQHDTPEKYLFAEQVRAISHGCIRVEYPLTYAELLLAIAAPARGYSKERLYGLLDGQERNIDFEQSIPIHLSYQTAVVDEAGRLARFDDPYGYDDRVLSLLERPRSALVTVQPAPAKPAGWAKWRGQIARWFKHLGL